MTFKCNQALRDILNQSPNKLAWATDLHTAIGDDRTIQCFRDNAANAADPTVTGVEFRRLKSTGAFTTKSGTIIGIGRLNGTTVQNSADMSTGTSVLKIIGGGHWFSGSLGLSLAAQRANGVIESALVQYDFEVDKNFTTTNGFGVKSNLTISGPRFLPSGVGPAAPAKADNMPHTMEIWDWRNPNSPVLAGISTLDTRIDDFVYEDQEIAAERGDAAVYQCSQYVPYGDWDFAPTLTIKDASNSEGGNQPLVEVVIAMSVSRTRTTWTTYPGVNTFNPSVHTTIPYAFKAILKDKNGNTLKVHEMSDGAPINGHKCMQGDWNENSRMAPNVTVGMQLPWWNVNPKRSTLLTKYFPGVIPETLRPSRAKVQYTGIGVEPLLTGGYQGNSANGLHNMFAQRKFSQPRVHQDPQPRDPYGVVDSEFNRSGASSEFWPWADGWGYEPGGFGGHNWYTGPGGPRFDRCPVPSTLAWWGTAPNAVRLQENVPVKDMAYNWALSCFNHSNHWCYDPRTMQLATNNSELLRDWGFQGQYYGDYRTSSPTVIDVRGGMRDGENASHFDKNGQFFWMGWNRDGLHSYGGAGWPALFMNSTILTMAYKWDAFWQLKEWGAGFGYRGDYMVRSQAWLWLHYTLAWKLASTHRLGIDRAIIEEFMTRHLENLHDDIWVKVFEQNEQGPFATGLRNLGQPVQQQSDGSFGTQGGGLGMYMANVLALMKTTGFWDRMYNMTPKCKKALDMQIRNMDKYCFDLTLDTSMERWPTVNVDLNNMPNWGTVQPPNGQADAFHGNDGTVYGDRDVSVHVFATYTYVRAYYFPEFINPRLAPSKAKWDFMLQAITDRVNAASDPADKRNLDHAYGYYGMGIWKQPT